VSRRRQQLVGIAALVGGVMAVLVLILTRNNDGEVVDPTTGKTASQVIAEENAYIEAQHELCRARYGPESYADAPHSWGDKCFTPATRTPQRSASRRARRQADEERRGDTVVDYIDCRNAQSGTVIRCSGHTTCPAGNHLVESGRAPRRSVEAGSPVTLDPTVHYVVCKPPNGVAYRANWETCPAGTVEVERGRERWFGRKALTTGSLQCRWRL